MGEKENIPAAGQARGRGERTDTGDDAGSPVARSAPSEMGTEVPAEEPRPRISQQQVRAAGSGIM